MPSAKQEHESDKPDDKKIREDLKKKHPEGLCSMFSHYFNINKDINDNNNIKGSINGSEKKTNNNNSTDDR